MSWEDMGLYWAWRNGGKYCQPPTEKGILYETVEGVVPFQRAIAVKETNAEGRVTIHPWPKQKELLKESVNGRENQPSHRQR